MFRGQYEHTIDAKGRLSIPSRFREVLQEQVSGSRRSPADRLIVTNIDRCLAAYAVPKFEEIVRKLEAKPQDEKVKSYTRFFVGGAHDVEIDDTGRILVPPPLRRFAELEKDVVLVGAIGRFEIWSAARWRAEQEKNQQLLVNDRDFIPEI